MWTEGILKRGWLWAFLFALIVSIACSLVIPINISMACPDNAGGNYSAFLEGYNKVTARWERGLLEGWRELDWVPYRIKFAKLPKGISNFNFNVYHNNLLQNKGGFDELRNFHVGDENGNPVDGSVTASGPFYKTPGKGCNRDIYYSLSVTFNIPSSKLDRYVYWEAHLAIGSSGWPGARLHTYIDITGGHDVPIKVLPAQAVRDVNVSIVPEYQTAAPWNWLEYTVAVTNTGNVDDVYNLSIADALGWDNIWLEDDTLWAAGCGGENSTKLHVQIPDGAEGNTEDNIIVTVISINDNAISTEDSCIARVTIVWAVDVLISPNSQSGSNGATLAYTVTVTNKGNVEDTYDLSVSDTAGLGTSSLSPPSLTIPPGENRTATLTITIPENAEGGTEDIITVTATGTGVSDSNSCMAHAVPPWMGTATFKLENLYKVSLAKDLRLYAGSKLVVKFYKYDNVTLQAESVIHSFTPPENVPENVKENENVPHPRGAEGYPWGSVQIARLVLTTDNTENVISTIASFTVHQSDLRNRIKDILVAWGGYPEQQSAFRVEVMDILKQWVDAPP